MALRTVITERQRRLGAELKKLRERSGMTIAEGGGAIGMGRVHLTHVEGGKTAIASERIRKLCQAYGCTSSTYVDALVDLSESSGKGWWTEYRKVMPQEALDLAELESRATLISSYGTLLIPGLLQTESYLRALYRTGRPDASAEEIEDLVRFRKARQAILTADTSVRFQAVIHESALRMCVGPSHVMRGQITHLLQVAKSPHVSVQVLPYDAGVAIPWFSAPFHILGRGIPGLETVIAEHPSANLRLGDSASIAQYQTTFEGLSKAALLPIVADGSPELHERRDSWGLIQHILYTH